MPLPLPGPESKRPAEWPAAPAGRRPPPASRLRLWLPWSLCSLHQFADQFTHLDLSRQQGLSTERSGAIDLAQGLAVAPLGRAQIALLSQTVQQRIERPRADSIP